MNSVFPPLPADTLEAARSAFGKQNAYILIGDHLDTLFAGIDFQALPQGGVAKEFPYLATLVLIFQFNEGLADRHAAEATRVRTDWKYALHLSLVHPGLRAEALCDFRMHLRAHAASKTQFGQVLERAQKIAALPPRQCECDADAVLQTVSTRTNLDMLAVTMQIAVQTLAATRYEWLRQIVPPHWYQRYSPSGNVFQLPDNSANWVALAESIGADGRYLLHAIAQTNQTDLAHLKEIQTLRQVWNVQFKQQNDQYQWQRP